MTSPDELGNKVFSRRDAQPVRTKTFFSIAFLVTFAAATYGDSDSEFYPPRQFPTSGDTIQVFVDQLPAAKMTAAQRRFAATRFAGMQKQTSAEIKQLRAYQPDFLMIQYCLGVRSSQANFIHNDTWSHDFSVVDKNKDWFVHDDKGNRAYQVFETTKEYVMDIQFWLPHHGGVTNPDLTTLNHELNRVPMKRNKYVYAIKMQTREQGKFSSCH